MFYPADSLRRGGKFYLLWLADSWPQHFASIKDNQIWSEDICKLCDYLNQLMVSESGRANRRYSLRLSSQLMRGLVRLYHRKAQSLLLELCMIEAKVISRGNKRVTTDEEGSDNERARPRARGHKRITSRPEKMERLGQPIEKILQNSGNVVANIQDITLREPMINEPAQPPNEGFGEENLEQALQFLSSRRSVEQMMVRSEPAASHSALGLPLDTDKSRDNTHLAPQGRDMERISGHDLTLLRPSDGGMLSTTDVGKDVSEIPDVPILPIPEMPDSRKKQTQEVAVEAPEATADKSKRVSHTRRSTQIELEELEIIEPRPRRRRKLIRDKATEIHSKIIRLRTRDPYVETRAKDPSELAVEIRVPFEVFVNRPCHAGFKERSNIAQTLTRLFMRNLGGGRRFAQQQFEEEELRRPVEYHARSTIDNIAEVERSVPELQIEKPQETNAAVGDNLAPLEMDISNRANVTEQPDITEMLTQKLEFITMSQEKTTGKRSNDETSTISKRQKTASDLPLGENQPRPKESGDMLARPEQEMAAELDMEVDKENIAANQQARGFVRFSTKQTKAKRITALLQEAGLSDVTPLPVQTEQPAPRANQSERRRSESSESLLGSLDRTKVSLGDSVMTTDSMKVIKDQWGTEGTMIKIAELIAARRNRETITVKKLIAQGPILADYLNIIMAKCFTSILKLKQHGFIKVQKCPETLEILDIMLGPKITNSS